MCTNTIYTLVACIELTRISVRPPEYKLTKLTEISRGRLQLPLFTPLAYFLENHYPRSIFYTCNLDQYYTEETVFT